MISSLLNPGGEHSFNFLDYESAKTNTGGSITGNLVQVLKTVIKASEDKDGDKGDDSFWETALDMLMFNVIDLCMLAYGKISVQLIFDIVLSAPKKTDMDNSRDKNKATGNGAFDHALQAAIKNVEIKVEAWKKTLSLSERKALEEEHVFQMRVTEAIPEAKVLRFIDQFFIDNYRSIGEKTRAIIEFSFTAFYFASCRNPFILYSAGHNRPLLRILALTGKLSC